MMDCSTTDSTELGVSVVICCYNSAARLPQTLAHLARQKVDGGIRWEVVLIDNASTDTTAHTARQLWPQPASAPLRIIVEPRPGKIHALSRALSEARYEFLSIVDDDNWVNEDWVQTVYSTMVRHPEVGILGASSSAVCEVEAPAWFHNLEILYAISPSTWQAGDFTCSPGSVWGAGMTVRKTAWKRIEECDCPRLLAGRLQESMAGSEDNELCYQIQLAGWKIWYEPRLHFRHFLPAGRLRWDYARRLVFGDGEAAPTLQLYERSLDALHKRLKPPYQYRWLWKFWTLLKDVARHPVLLAEAAIFPREGSKSVLMADQLRGRLRTLLRIRAFYDECAREVEQFSARLGGQDAKEHHAIREELAKR